MFRFLSKMNILPVSAASAVCLVALEKKSSSFESFCEENKKKTVYSWGFGGFGQLGHGNEKDIATPTKVLLSDPSKNPVQVGAGGDSSAILCEDGSVFTFGAGDNSRLGHGYSIDTPNQSTPQLVGALQGERIVKIALGDYHMAVLSEDGRVWTWGKNDTPQLGHNNEKVGFPNQVAAIDGKVKDIACGRQQTIAVTTDGKVYSWGFGYEGSLGHGDRADVDEPKLLSFFSDQKAGNISQVVCGREYTLCLAENGKVYAWGANDYGQLGVAGGMRYQRSPVVINSLENKEVISLAAGSFHSVALTKNGEVYTWGCGKEGQLGNGSNQDCNIPQKVTSLPPIVSVTCGGGHTACVAEDGSLWLFGRGRSGQLGRGDKLESIAAYRTEPIQVNLPEQRQSSQVSCGNDHTIALSS